MGDKIYCKYCMHILSVSLHTKKASKCKHPKNVVRQSQSDWYDDKVAIEYTMAPAVKNKKNDCSDFSRDLSVVQAPSMMLYKL